MGAKELAYSMIDGLNEEQLNALIVILKSMQKPLEHTRDAEVDALCGILHDYANSKLIPLEETAWKQAAIEKHRRITEAVLDEDS